ncbi:hypothetical protein G9A89_003905 [Geosiphon pyriformis]|nr:hypothetical protein G9A89_003905 [Geosiphon pyriformis]
MATQKNKASGTTNHVLFVANNYSMKKCGTTFLVEEERVTLCANTQSSLATGSMAPSYIPPRQLSTRRG